MWAILDHPAVIEFFAEIVVKYEVKSDKDIYKDIHIKSNCQDVYSSMLIFQGHEYCSEVWVSETTQKKSLQKHLKSEICWKGNAYYSAFSCFTGRSCPGIFFYSNTHWLFSWRVSSS